MSQLSIEHHNASVLMTLEEGDLVEFKRGLYNHWGVYTGNGMVIHLSGLNDGIGDGFGAREKKFTISGTQFDKAYVQEEHFLDVAKNDKAFKNNAKDNKLTPLDRKTIVERAQEKIGEIGYNVIWKNCEHFAAWCRYDVNWSEQVDTILTWASIGSVAAAFLGLLFGMCRSRARQQNQ